MPAAENVESEVACFGLFFNEEILTKIEASTNKNVDNMIQSMNQKQREYVRTTASWIKATSVSELKAYFGLMIYRGVYQWSYQAVEKFWTEVPIFESTMSMRRFFFLNRNISFDDKETRADRWTRDRGAAVREVFEEWNELLAQAVYVGKV